MTNYFQDIELHCPCCGVKGFSGELLFILNTIREDLNRPVILNSAYRCEKQNKKVGGSATSSHLKGLAVDIRCSNSSARFELLKILMNYGIHRVGISETFIHADIDKDKQQFVMWTY